MKTVWLDLETTGLNTEYTNIIGFAYWPEVAQRKLCPKGPRYITLQPLLHMEDHIYGAQELENVVNHFNVNLNSRDPEYLSTCVLREGTIPLFAYSRGSLSFQMPAPDCRNPADWLLDQTRKTPSKALNAFFEELESVDYDNGPSRWTIASYNAPFDIAVLSNFARRVWGETRAKAFLDNFTFYHLDILQLARWGIQGGKILSQQASLKTVCAALGVTYNEDPSQIALSDLLAAQKVASKLLYGETNEHDQKPRSLSSQVSTTNLS